MYRLYVGNPYTLGFLEILEFEKNHMILKAYRMV